MSQIDESDSLRVDLTYLPQVNDLLHKLGLGLLRSGMRRRIGRQPNWSGTTTTGNRVFVKRIVEDQGDVFRFDRLVRFEALRADSDDPVPMPRCLGWDRPNGLIVFELLEPSLDCAQLADDGAFGTETAVTIGRSLAALHGADMPPQATPPPRFPPTAELAALPLSMFVAASAAELELWRLLQNDPDLVAALRELRATEDAMDGDPTHCDIRLDQFVQCAGRVYLTDWEEFRFADPARDVGAFVGDWLYRATLSVVDEVADDESEFTHSAVLERAEAEFSAARPLIDAFWREYRAARRPDDAFVARAAQYAGWHQLERLIAAARNRSRLLPIERAVAGIARSLLLDPAQLAPALGLATRDGHLVAR